MTMDRIEVITSVERRRRWSAADKARLVAAMDEPGAVVTEIARREGVGGEPFVSLAPGPERRAHATDVRASAGGARGERPGDDGRLQRVAVAVICWRRRRRGLRSRSRSAIACG